MCKYLNTTQTILNLKVIGLTDDLAYFGIFHSNNGLLYLHVFSIDASYLLFDEPFIDLTLANYAAYNLDFITENIDVTNLFACFCKKNKLIYFKLESNEQIVIYNLTGKIFDSKAFNASVKIDWLVAWQFDSCYGTFYFNNKFHELNTM